MLVNRKFGCFGVKLFKLGRIQAELWFCPSSSYIQPHKHPNIDSIFIHLLGKAEIQRDYQAKKLPWFTWFEHHRIASNQIHSAIVPRGSIFIFLNIEKWSCEPSSASKDIVYE